MNNKKIRVTVSEMQEMLIACNNMLNRKLTEKLAEAVVQTKVGLLNAGEEVKALKIYTEELFADNVIEKDKRLKKIQLNERTLLVADIDIDKIKALDYLPDKAKVLIEKLFGNHEME